MTTVADSGIDLDPANYPALARSRRFSLDVIRALAIELEQSLGADNGSILTIVAGGSLGRLEASPQSDVDCIIIVDDRADDDPDRLASTVAGVVGGFSRFGLRPPKAQGIYCRPLKVSTLLDPCARGSLDEPPAVFGSRMQLLLDARPLFRADRFVSLREQLVAWYSPPSENDGGWTHLLNDLCRYLHAYAVWQQFKFTRSGDDGWYLRQAKLRSTRIATFAGLMFLLGESGRQQGEQGAWLLAQLDRSPIGRLKLVYGAYREADFSAVIDLYESLHQMLSDPAVRRELIDSSPGSAADLSASRPAAYARIHQLSEALMGCLTQFVLCRRDDWSPSFFRNWLL